MRKAGDGRTRKKSSMCKGPGPRDSSKQGLRECGLMRLVRWDRLQGPWVSCVISTLRVMGSH